MSSRGLLVQCVKEHDWSLPPPGLEQLDGESLARLGRASLAHRVAGCVYRSLSAAGRANDIVGERLGEEYRRALANHMRAMVDLRAAADIFAGAGIPWLVIKGPILSEVYYRDPALRSYLDVDLIVPPAELRLALRVLEKGGCRIVEDGWQCGPRNLSAEVHLILPYGTPLDLHWHLLNDASLRRAVALPVAEIFGRPRSVDIDGDLSLRTLDPEDTVIYLALHAVVSGGNRLVWMKDLEQALLAGVDWGVVIERANGSRAGLAVGAMLAQARATLGAPVPDEALRQLSWSRAWFGLVRAAELVSPFDAPSCRVPSSQVVRATRDGVPASLGRLAYRVGGGFGRVPMRQIRDRIGQRGDLRWRPNSGLRRSPFAYCDAVERVGWNPAP